MKSHGSVSVWLEQIQQGDPEAATQLWQRYFRRLVGLARTALHGASRAVADEEDVALSAFDSFCRGAEGGRFPDLRDRDGLWGLLVVLTTRKAAHLRRAQLRQKRGGGKVVEEEPLGFDGVAGQEPTPEFAAQVAEECERLLQRLGDTRLRSIALWKMEGFTNVEIAERLGCCLSTVERQLQVIRRLWRAEDPESGA